MERFSAARIHRLVAAIEAANVKTAPLLSAPLGRQFRDFGKALPVELSSDFVQRAGGQAGLPASDMWSFI